MREKGEKTGEEKGEEQEREREGYKERGKGGENKEGNERGAKGEKSEENLGEFFGDSASMEKLQVVGRCARQPTSWPAGNSCLPTGSVSWGHGPTSFILNHSSPITHHSSSAPVRRHQSEV